MSINTPTTIECPACQGAVDVEVAFSVNGGRHDHFRQAILDGNYQRYGCPHCSETFRLDPDLTYFDATRGVWILCRPLQEVDGWDEVEEGAHTIFAKAFGPQSPPPARAMGAELSVRVVFGWPALREKLAASDAGLDDVELELTKLALLAGLGGGPLADGVELRLLGIDDDDQMVFIWQHGDTELVVESLTVPRKLYDDVASDFIGWADLRDELRKGPFVDIDRLMVEPVPA